jgi:hypothetical protein
MNRFTPPQLPSAWSSSWHSRWSGNGGPQVVLFNQPVPLVRQLTKRFWAVFTRQELVSMGARKTGALAGSVTCTAGRTSHQLPGGGRPGSPRRAPAV